MHIAVCLVDVVPDPHLKERFTFLSHLIRTGPIYHLQVRPYFSLVSSCFSPRPQDKENSMKEKEPSEFKPPNPEDSHSNHPSKVSVSKGTWWSSDM